MKEEGTAPLVLEKHGTDFDLQSTPSCPVVILAPKGRRGGLEVGAQVFTGVLQGSVFSLWKPTKPHEVCEW